MVRKNLGELKINKSKARKKPKKNYAKAIPFEHRSKQIFFEKFNGYKNWIIICKFYAKRGKTNFQMHRFWTEFFFLCTIKIYHTFIWNTTKSEVLRSEN